MDKVCKKYYLIDILIDGNIIRKGTYTKIMSPITHQWMDYDGKKVTNPIEISRLDTASLSSTEVDCNFDDYQYFMQSINKIDNVSSIPTDKHIVLASIDPTSDEMFLNMKYLKGVEGDSYVVYIENIGLTSTTVFAPSDSEGDKDDPSYVPVLNNINVGSRFISVNPGGTEVIRVTYRDSKWYWEIVSKQSSSPNNAIIGEADYLVFRYIWESDSGRDLDTATEVLNSGVANIDNKAVGWNCSGNNIADVKSLLKWGGDNTGSGKECVYMSINDLRSKYLSTLPDITELMTYATWYRSKGTGRASFNLIAYKGGTMSQDGYNFINTGGEVVYNGVHTFDVTTLKGSPDYKTRYTKVTKVFYNKTTNMVSMSVGESIVEDQNQLNDLKLRMVNAEKDISVLKTDVDNIEKKTNIGMIVHEVSDTTVSLKSNKYHVWDVVPSLNISLAPYDNVNIMNEYSFTFKSGATATVLTLPSSVVWASTLDIKPNYKYQVSILDNIALIGGVPDEII